VTSMTAPSILPRAAVSTLRELLEDRRLLKVCASVGIAGLVPIVGWALVLGWMRACYEARKVRAPVPDLSRASLLEGLVLLVGAGLPIALGVAGGVALASIDRAGLLWLWVPLFAALLPATMLRILARHDVAAGLSPFGLYDVVRRAPRAYLRLVLVLWGTQLALLVAGVALSVIGLVLAQPIAIALHAVLYADFARAHGLDHAPEAAR